MKCIGIAVQSSVTLCLVIKMKFHATRNQRTEYRRWYSQEDAFKEESNILS